MTPERFRQTEELYQPARETHAHERMALLAQVDPEARRDIESLPDQPVTRNESDLREDLTFAMLAPNVFLGPYRIEVSSARGLTPASTAKQADKAGLNSARPKE